MLTFNQFYILTNSPLVKCLNKKTNRKDFYFLHLHLDFHLNLDSHLLSLNLLLCSNLCSHIGNHTLQVSSKHFFTKSFIILTPSLILYMHLLIVGVDKYCFSLRFTFKIKQPSHRTRTYLTIPKQKPPLLNHSFRKSGLRNKNER